MRILEFKIIDQKRLILKELSMLMSVDYEVAINFNTTFVRIGSLIFGQRA